ncbi:MAG: M20/M25/M40 family metallo-hydrolase [Acidobacteria bacterium]|nr:M20/M25/M40 family metallo-hydrolase [Acidobacteriota bacterium]
MLSIDSAYLTATLRDLVRINSVNPSLDPGSAGERVIAEYVAASLAAFGVEAALHECAPGRPSVVGRLRGSRPGRSLMLNAHIDTVDLVGMEDPLSGDIRAGRLYGRGAYDMKGGLAAMMAGMKALADAGCPHGGEVVLTGVADEEYASAGMQDLLTRYRTDGAIVTEPTALDICLAHKGFAWFEITTHGRAAHGSRFDLGVDANMRMGRVLADLDRLEQDLRARAPHPLVGPPSLHAATLSGGSGLSTYAASCRLQIERRTVPGECIEAVTEEMASILRRQMALDPAFAADLGVMLVREPFEVSPDAPIVRALVEASTDVLGHRPAFAGQTPWMDAALLAAAGVETVVMGAAGAGAHAKEEWVDLESVTRLAACLAAAAIRYCV